MMVQNSEGWNNGGIRRAMDPEPSHRLVYFGVEDIDAGLSKVSQLGGTRIIGPMDIGVGKIGVLQDPQGAMFALFAGQFEP
jgi:predicted enzyme related to lactoylglutathione lyase